MPPFQHRKSSFLHEWRHGWEHRLRHKNGIRHKHRRRSSTKGASGTVNRRLIKRRIGIGAGLTVFLLGFLTMAAAYRALVHARGNLENAERAASMVSGDPERLTSSDGRASVATSLGIMDRQTRYAAETVNNSIPLTLLGFLPVVGTQVDGVRSLVGDLHTTSNQGRILLRDLQAVTNNSHPTDISIPDLQALSSQVTSSQAILSALQRPSSGLLGPIQSARNKFNQDLTKITGLLGEGGKALEYSLPFLGAEGPRTYFMAAENNSEMRDQGAVLSWALIQADNGSYSVNSPDAVRALYLAQPAPFPLPSGTEQVFGPLQPTQLWQSTNATADFPLSAADMATMYATATNGGHVDGVIALDVVMLRSLLELTGPVSVPGIDATVTSANVETLVLNRLYTAFPPDAQQERKDQLSTIAKAVVDKLKSSDVDVAKLVKTFAKGVQGRHLLVWDQTPKFQKVVEEFAASGSVSAVDPESTFHLAVESATAAKVDYYIHTAVAYQVTVDSSGKAYVQTTVTIRNRAPKNARPSYALGPDNTNTHRPGEYASRVYLWTPRGSVVPGGIPESGLVVDPTSVNVNPGDVQVLNFQAVLPHAVKNGHMNLRFIPQSSLYPQETTLSIQGRDVLLQGKNSYSWKATTTKSFSIPVKN